MKQWETNETKHNHSKSPSNSNIHNAAGHAKVEEIVLSSVSSPLLGHLEPQSLDLLLRNYFTKPKFFDPSAQWVAFEFAANLSSFCVQHRGHFNLKKKAQHVLIFLPQVIELFMGIPNVLPMIPKDVPASYSLANEGSIRLKVCRLF